jgi:hypothetical protein
MHKAPWYPCKLRSGTQCVNPNIPFEAKVYPFPKVDAKKLICLKENLLQLGFASWSWYHDLQGGSK